MLFRCFTIIEILTIVNIFITLLIVKFVIKILFTRIKCLYL